MSQDRRTNAQKVVRRHLMIIGLSLLSPVLLWFVTWMAATASGATPPSFAYGFGFTYADAAHQVAQLWAGGPEIPVQFVQFFNLGFGAIVFLVAGVAGFTMIGSIGALVGEDEG